MVKLKVKYSVKRKHLETVMVKLKVKYLVTPKEKQTLMETVMG